MKDLLLCGLSQEQVLEQRAKFGVNELAFQKKEPFYKKVIHIISEPMFLLLILAALIYFFLGEPKEGAIMLVFVVAIITIEVVQEWKTDKTLHALKELTTPQIEVLRDSLRIMIPSNEIVVGDVMFIAEGVKIPADGRIVKFADLCIDESSLTGESLGVWKTLDDTVHNDYWRKDYCYAGTLVSQGSATIIVEKIGNSTEYGKIGQNMVEIKDQPSPLSIETGRIVKTASVIALVCFVLAFVITFFNLADYVLMERLTKSLLGAIPLAMAMIPEEFPVILAVFLSMGAWRLAKKEALIRKLPAVETLGAVSVLCVDKTGTITMNQMSVVKTYIKKDTFVEVMGLACEIDVYDPMEIAMLAYCEAQGVSKEHIFSGTMINEYPFTNELKMMGHIWHHDDEIIIATKGSAENVLKLCKMSDQERHATQEQILLFSQMGLRVIAVAQMCVKTEADIPGTIVECEFEFCGLVGLEDPPRPTIKHDIEACVKAGVRVVMITGDNGITAKAIADQIGMPNTENVITGEHLIAMTEEQLNEAVLHTSVFSRVLPEHKMLIVKAFKSHGHVVAMTGDGVNDAVALKYADIGIAMGKHGSQVSREAADIILLDDNFSTIVSTIEDGRRIFENIRKAIGYVFTIHIPIAFSALLAPLIGISPVNFLLLPLHVVLLELIIDPTCSVVLERQPAELDIMERKPRNLSEKMLNKATLLKSFVQGIAIFAGSFSVYYTVLLKTNNIELARTMGLGIIILANLILVFENSSDHDSIVLSIRRLVKDRVMWIVVLLTLMLMIATIYTPLREFVGFSRLTFNEMALVVVVATITTLWYEIVKFIKRRQR